MYCCNVIDDVVINRTFRKKSDDIEHIICKHVPDAKVYTLIGNNEECTLLEMCRKLVEVSEDTIGNNWFASDNQLTVHALALLNIIETYRLWSVLQDESTFEKWVEGRIR